MPMDTTIAAISTPPGVGAVAMIRVSGPDTFSVCDRIFKKNKSFKLALAEKNTVHYGKIVENSSGTVIDEVIAAIPSPIPNQKTSSPEMGEEVQRLRDSSGIRPFAKRRIPDLPRAANQFYPEGR